MAGRYAENTSVGSEQSRMEIERTLSRYGAESFAYGWQASEAIVAFQMAGRQIRFRLPMPDRSDPEFTTYRQGSSTLQRTESAAKERYEQAIRQRWRALALVIKAKLEAVESGITEFEDEFLAHILLPDGGTVGDWMRPQISDIYALKQMPALMPGVG